MKNSYRLRQAVQSIVRPLFKHQGISDALLLMEWKTIIGSQYAPYIECEKIKFPPGKKTDGTIILWVEKAMALFVQHTELILLEKINTFFGYKAITRIILKQGQLNPPLVLKPQKKINITQHQLLTNLLLEAEPLATQEALQELATLLSLEDK